MSGKWDVLHKELMQGKTMAVPGNTRATVRTTLCKLLAQERRAMEFLGIECEYIGVNVTVRDGTVVVKYNSKPKPYEVVCNDIQRATASIAEGKNGAAGMQRGGHGVSGENTTEGTGSA